MSKTSICMATRNGERYIRRQMESILTQLRPDDEVVVSDDSSTDDTLRIIRDFRDERIQILEGNRFFSPVFNFENALKKAAGDIIVLSDQDDIWRENKIAVIRSRLEGREGRIHTLVLDGEYIDEEGSVIGSSIFARYRSGKGLLKNIYDNTYMGCCMAFTRDLLKIALPFPPDIPMHDMWLGLLSELFGRVEFVPEKTVQYRRHSSNITDFRRSFAPLRQIGWRYALVKNLIMRSISLRLVRGKSSDGVKQV